MNFAQSSSAAAMPLRASSCSLVKSSTGTLARFSVASITFFCWARNLSSLPCISSSFCLTSSGSLLSGRFFISANTSAWACRVTSKSFRNTSMIRSCEAVNSGVGFLKSSGDFSFINSSHRLTAWSMSPNARPLRTRLMESRSSRSVGPIDLTRSTVAFWISICWVRISAAVWVGERSPLPLGEG